MAEFLHSDLCQSATRVDTQKFYVFLITVDDVKMLENKYAIHP